MLLCLINVIVLVRKLGISMKIWIHPALYQQFELVAPQWYGEYFLGIHQGPLVSIRLFNATLVFLLTVYLGL